MSDSSPINSAIQAALADAQASFQRRLLVLSGSRSWSSSALEQLLAEREFSDAVLVAQPGDREREGGINLPVIVPEKTGTLLGRTIELAIYDAWSGLNPDALAAVAGAVAGGGLLILCAPPLSQWASFADPDYRRMLVYPFTIEAISGRFLQFLCDAIQRDDSLFLIEEGREIVARESSPATGYPPARPERGTEDQRRAVEAIVHVLEGHSRRPLVITSDRGRGKSAALGIAGARIMRSGGRRLLITAPRPAAVASVFYHAALELGIEPPAAQVDHLAVGDACLRFVAPDELLRHPVAADLLMIDEAAAIPAPLLEGLARRYNRTVFSTTVHGYEGTGRGFEIRFKKALLQIANQVRELSLAEPIRWAEGDPVERWLFRALLLNAAPAQLGDIDELNAHSCSVEEIDRDLLLQQSDTLRELFGLLVLAHYRTTPSDLRNLLDGPNVSIWLSRYRGKVVAAALIAREGGFEVPLAQAVWRGARRPRGHLLAQTLSSHAGLEQAPQLHYWRVMRIAVHPHLQRRGLGAQLIQSLQRAARSRGVDILGSSFAATADVVAFWHNSGCQPVRLGVTRDASSGCHSALVLCACSESGQVLLDKARGRFAEQFPRELESLFADLDAALVRGLLTGLPVFNAYRMGSQDWQDVHQFNAGGRHYSDCRLALWKLVLSAIEKGVFGDCLAPAQARLLLAVALQNRGEKAVCEELGIDGKKTLLRELRQAVGNLAAMLQRG